MAASREREPSPSRREPDERARLEAFAALARTRSASTSGSGGAQGDGVRRALGWTLVVAGLVLVAALTLVPTAEGNAAPFWCLRCGDRAKADVLLNMLLFAPLGAGLGVLGVRFGRAIALAFACTLVVELLQYAVVPGRDAAARDLVANTMGAALGFAVGRSWHRWVLPHPRAARHVAWIASLAWIASQAVTAIVVSPWLPVPDWWARLRPRYDAGDRVYTATFAGRLLEVNVGGVDVPQSDEIPRAWNARQALLEGQPLRVVLDGVRPSAGLAPVAIVTAGPVYDVVAWVQDGRDALFQSSVRGARVGLRAPAVRFRNAMPILPVDTVVLEGSYAHGRYLLRTIKNGVTRERRLDASASRVWMFLVRSARYAVGEEVYAITALWLVVAWLVLGYWYFRSAAGAGRAVAWAGLAVTAVLGLAVVPLLAGIPVSGWSEWAAVAGGVAMGAALARATRRDPHHAFV